MQQTTSIERPFDKRPIVVDIHQLLSSREISLNSESDLLDFFLSHEASKRPLETVFFTFKKNSYYLRSILHTSFVHEFKSLNLESNEKLEFLGDSVLSTLVSGHLINEFPKLNEGELSKFRSSLVNGTVFAELAQLLGLGDCLLLGKGELQSDGHLKEAILADTFEAFIGAIYRDSGFSAVSDCFYSLLEAYEKQFSEKFINERRLIEFDAKSRLQEKTMALYKTLPIYKSTMKKDQTFHVEIFIEGKCVGAIDHISKKKAERELASKVLQEYQF